MFVSRSLTVPGEITCVGRGGVVTSSCVCFGWVWTFCHGI